VHDIQINVVSVIPLHNDDKIPAANRKLFPPQPAIPDSLSFPVRRNACNPTSAIVANTSTDIIAATMANPRTARFASARTIANPTNITRLPPVAIAPIALVKGNVRLIVAIMLIISLRISKIQRTFGLRPPAFRMGAVSHAHLKHGRASLCMSNLRVTHRVQYQTTGRQTEFQTSYFRHAAAVSISRNSLLFLSVVKPECR
jgi:hypothetical protein